jgi:hypothetical protein
MMVPLICGGAKRFKNIGIGRQPGPMLFYGHCFAHQLQLVVVAIVKALLPIGHFFGHLNKIVGMVSASFKKKDALLQIVINSLSIYHF